MKNLVSKSALVCALAMMSALSLWSEVKVVLTASKIVKTEGTEQRQPGDKARPGEVIEYVADYRNTDKRPVSNVKATLPVPHGMEYLPETANPVKVMASTDDVHYAPVPLKRSAKNADGKVVEQMVPYSEYKSLRWDLGEIAGEAAKSVKARMKVRAQAK